jgi:hypothetical protein
MHKNKHIAPRTDRIRILVAIREPLHLGDPILRTGYCLARIVAVEHIRHLQELDRPGFRDQCITRSLSGTDDVVVAHLPLLRQQALRPRRSYSLQIQPKDANAAPMRAVSRPAFFLTAIEPTKTPQPIGACTNGRITLCDPEGTAKYASFFAPSRELPVSPSEAFSANRPPQSQYCSGLRS